MGIIYLYLLLFSFFAFLEIAFFRREQHFFFAPLPIGVKNYSGKTFFLFPGGIMFCLSAICIVCLPFVLFFRQLCCLSENCIFFKCENHLVLLRNEIVVCLFLQFTQIYSRFAFKWKISVQNRILFTK